MSTPRVIREVTSGSNKDCCIHKCILHLRQDLMGNCNLIVISNTGLVIAALT